MSGPSLLQAAVDELYSSPMAEFTARRKALAAAARKSGERETAGEIAGLRKPTVSADTLNRLVRVAPDEVGELLDLGAELRAAEKALDGPALRELSTKRRHLVGELANLAFEITDQQSPSAAVRDEVTATLNAALGRRASGRTTAVGRAGHPSPLGRVRFDLTAGAGGRPADGPGPPVACGKSRERFRGGGNAFEASTKVTADEPACCARAAPSQRDGGRDGYRFGGQTEAGTGRASGGRGRGGQSSGRGRAAPACGSRAIGGDRGG